MEDSKEHPAVRKFVKEINAGTIMLVLLTILESSDPLYGYEIAKRLEVGTRMKLPMKKGTIYPALRSMEVKELLESKVEPSVSGPPRKYYSITKQGREVLATLKQVWRQTQDFVEAELQGELNQVD